MAKGKVKWFDSVKGFGFIESEGEDYFVHFRSINSSENYKKLEQDQIVEFEPTKGVKGMMASNVSIVKSDLNNV